MPVLLCVPGLLCALAVLVEGMLDPPIVLEAKELIGDTEVVGVALVFIVVVVTGALEADVLPALLWIVAVLLVLDIADVGTFIGEVIRVFKLLVTVEDKVDDSKDVEVNPELVDGAKLDE